MRGHIERAVGRLNVEVSTGSPGATGKNIAERGDRKPEREAALTLDHLQQLVLLWIVDAYHHTPHDGLGGTTPAEEWDSYLGAADGPRPLPEDDAMRVVFGTPEYRIVQRQGIFANSVYYHSPALADWFKRNDDRRVEVRSWDNDIGAISVLLDGSWHTLECTDPRTKGLNGVQWRAAKARARGLAKAADPVGCILNAYRKMDAVKAHARISRGLYLQPHSPEALAAAEHDTTMGFRKAALHASGSSDKMLQHPDQLPGEPVPRADTVSERPQVGGRILHPAEAYLARKGSEQSHRPETPPPTSLRTRPARPNDRAETATESEWKLTPARKPGSKGDKRK
ncbi:Mu transposase C-terminal domain-containing protein [Falsigemmobacter intermedius]